MHEPLPAMHAQFGEVGACETGARVGGDDVGAVGASEGARNVGAAEVGDPVGAIEDGALVMHSAYPSRHTVVFAKGVHSPGTDK